MWYFYVDIKFFGGSSQYNHRERQMKTFGPKNDLHLSQKKFTSYQSLCILIIQIFDFDLFFGCAN